MPNSANRGPERPGLVATATQVARRVADDANLGDLVILVDRPGSSTQVIGSSGTGVIRAAVSVAAANGNDAAWRDVPTGSGAVVPLDRFAEVVVGAAAPVGVRQVHIARAHARALVLWFETRDGVATEEQRREVVAQLERAGLDEDALIAEAGRTVQSSAPAPVAHAAVGDPDAVLGMLDADGFAEAMAAFDRDEATLTVVDIDDYPSIVAQWGTTVASLVAEVVAGRLADNCRRIDRIGHVADDRFAILFGEMDRSAVLQVAKRIMAAFSEPLGLEQGPATVSATVAVVHQAGLVDLDEMMESAVDALASSRRGGPGRLIVAD